MVEMVDTAYIDFLLETEVNTLKLSDRVCRVFFKEKLFGRLWTYSRLEKLVPL